MIPKMKLGDYELDSIIGQGAFGTVLNAEKRGSFKKYAIKVVERTERMMASINYEVTALKEFNHPNIIKLQEIIRTKTHICLVQAKSGQDLWSSCKTYFGNEEKIKHIFAQVVSALYHIHRKGYVHRDISAGNILLTGENEDKVVIIDFGMCRKFSKDGILNNMKTVCGTLGFVAPELNAQGAEYHGDSSDIWSCGVILYYLLYNNLPYKNDSYYEKKGDEPPVEFPEHIGRPNLYEDAKDLIRMMLLKNPKMRCDWKTVMNHKWLENYRSFFQYHIDLVSPHIIYPIRSTELDIDLDLKPLKEVKDNKNPGSNLIVHRSTNKNIKKENVFGRNYRYGEGFDFLDDSLPTAENGDKKGIKGSKDSLELYKDRQLTKMIQDLAQLQINRIVNRHGKTSESRLVKETPLNALKLLNSLLVEKHNSATSSKQIAAAGMIPYNRDKHLHGQDRPLRSVTNLPKDVAACREPFNLPTPFSGPLINKTPRHIAIPDFAKEIVLSNHKVLSPVENRVPSHLAIANPTANKVPYTHESHPLVKNTTPFNHTTPGSLGLQNFRLKISKLSPHKGKINPRTMTSRSPDEMLASIKGVLLNMGILNQMSGDQKIKCFRPQVEESSIVTRIQNALCGLFFGDQGKDIRFTIQLNRLNNVPGFYVVNIKNIQGNNALFKSLRKDILDSLDMYT
ncbi:Pkinase-domain-containing protein [Backusella circina FSU 941]|nr:Pkinase-domain-containing protein [Backusella circina FSU 941]